VTRHRLPPHWARRRRHSKGILGVVIVVGAPVVAFDHLLERSKAHWVFRAIAAVFIFVSAFAVLNQIRQIWPALDGILLIR
jgi:uncharacterized protein YybS (DUF2232 family)